MLGASEIAELLETHGLAARKSLGQNFVADPNTVARIVEHAGVSAGSKVLEIGPGVGSLSVAVTGVGASLLAVEKDEALQPVLEEVLARDPDAEYTVICADALELDYRDLLGGERHTLVANLPYNVAVPIILDVMERAPEVDPLVVMVQREVADRLCASPGGRTIGIPTLKAAWYCDARIVMNVPPTVFIPQPRVDSAVVRFDRHDPPGENPAPVFALLERAYNQRRKMLRRSLGAGLAEAMSVAEIDPTRRPESLSLQEWVRLAAAQSSGAPG